MNMFVLLTSNCKNVKTVRYFMCRTVSFIYKPRKHVS